MAILKFALDIPAAPRSAFRPWRIRPAVGSWLDGPTELSFSRFGDFPTPQKNQDAHLFHP